MHEKITSCDGHKISYIFSPSLANNAKKLCILTHGLFSSKSENGRFERLSKILNDAGFDTICFDFRGHGDSELLSAKFSISGALNDLSAVISTAENDFYNDIVLVASSFSACVGLLYYSHPMRATISKLVLLNPVLDLLDATQNAKDNNGVPLFTDCIVQSILENGSAVLSNGFTLSIDFYNELHHLQPYRFLDKIRIPIIVFHGTLDEKINYQIIEKYFIDRANTKLILVKDSTHAFKNTAHEEFVFEALLSWIS